MAISPDSPSTPNPAFDPTSAVVFELSSGQIRRAQGPSAVLMPAGVFASLCETLDSAQRATLGAALGEAAGSALKAAGPDAQDWSLPQIVDWVGGEVSLAGFGALSIERLGDALIIHLQGCPLGAAGPEVMRAYIQRLLHVLVGRSVCAVAVESTPGGLRFLLCSPQAADRVQPLINAGSTLVDALESLQVAANQGAH